MEEDIKLYFIKSKSIPSGTFVEGSRLYLKPELNGYVAVLDEAGRPLQAFSEFTEAREATDEEYGNYYEDEE